MNTTESTETYDGMSMTCEKRIAATGSRCQREVGHKGLCHPRPQPAAH